MPLCKGLNIEVFANNSLLQGLANDYQIINPKELTQEARSVFSKVNVFKNLFFLTLVIIGLAIYSLAMKLLLNSKSTSLKVIECLGMSRSTIGLNLSIFVLLSLSACLFIGQQLSLLTHSQIAHFVGLSS